MSFYSFSVLDVDHIDRMQFLLNRMSFIY